MKATHNNEFKTRERLIEHYRTYPCMRVTDIFKYVFQSSFGCEHLVSDFDAALGYIRRELATVNENDTPLVEQLDGEYSRVYLSYISCGLSAETLAKIFCLSAKSEPDGRTALCSKLQTVRELVREGVLPFSEAELDRDIKEWCDMGYPAVRHSEDFRAAYRPAYRVISDKYVRLLPLLTRIDTLLRQGRVILAIDGGCAAGKSTLADTLQRIYDCTVFHMDDYFLRPEQRTAQRYREIGGNVDRERFEAEILKPLSEKRDTITYMPFNCTTQELESPVCVVPKGLIIVEGSYSMHPDLFGYYDSSVYLDVDIETRRARILERNSQRIAERFFNEWIPLEETYFSNMRVRERADIVIEN